MQQDLLLLGEAPELAGLRVSDVPAAESGIGAAILAKAKGYNALLSDNGPIKETYKHDLESYQLEWEENGHDEERILSCDLIIKSPGVPHKVSIIKKAIEKNKSAKHNAKSKALLKAKGYTGHYQETATGQIRHQSPSQVAKKKLGA